MSDYILFIGISLFLGFYGGKLLSKIKIPMVTGYIISGVLVGNILDLFNYSFLVTNLSVISNITLVFVAYFIGAELRTKELKQMGRVPIFVALGESIFAFLSILFFLTLFFFLFTNYFTEKNISKELIVLLAAIGSATAPAVTLLVIQELKAKGILTQTLLTVVGSDDAIGIMIYAFSASYVHSILSSHNVNFWFYVLIFLKGLFQITISIITGLLFGIILDNISKKSKIKPEFINLTLAILFILFAMIDKILPDFFESFNIENLHFSVLLAAMSLGFYIVNYSRNRNNLVHSIDDISQPFYVLFFFLAGARLKIIFFKKYLFFIILFFLARIFGKIFGAYIGGKIAKAPDVISKYLGFGLISQAGVAIALTLISIHEFPQYSNQIIGIVLGSTLLTEIIGPIMVKYALLKSGEAYKRYSEKTSHIAYVKKHHKKEKNNVSNGTSTKR